jgi:L,D-peptidoglycan transpeptidase YkuD (ErfK/YbiS/YcfS/YnhG family)
MTIILKNKGTLIFDDFKFRCCVGKMGITNNKIEGDKKTPSGLFSLGKVFYRKDRNLKPITKLNLISIKKTMGWCNDIKSKNYNKLININSKTKYEKMFRRDYKYDYVIPINYNTKRTRLGKGSAIFIHLTKNYLPTAGCVGIKKKDMLILLNLINKKTKIKIFDN